MGSPHFYLLAQFSYYAVLCIAFVLFNLLLLLQTKHFLSVFCVGIFLRAHWEEFLFLEQSHKSPLQPRQPGSIKCSSCPSVTLLDLSSLCWSHTTGLSFSNLTCSRIEFVLLCGEETKVSSVTAFLKRFLLFFFLYLDLRLKVVIVLGVNIAQGLIAMIYFFLLDENATFSSKH